MPWIRIDEHAMSHPKITGLSDGAFRLWVQALTHCQNFLTDGVVVPIALKGMSAYAPRRRAELIAARLWVDGPDGGISVHDYLQWNDSRQQVTASREHGRDRKRRWRDRWNASGDAGQDGRQTRSSPVRGVGGDTTDSASTGKGETGETSLTARAGAFCEWYADTHERLFGIGYMGTNGDYTKAQELCAKFSDKDLRDGALVWFGMEDDFATRGTRTVPKFASRATHCIQIARKVSA